MNRKKLNDKELKEPTLSAVLRNSPLVGLDLDFSRPQDYPRDIDFRNFADEPRAGEAKEPNKELKR
jgi:hypothetical protein